MPVEKRDVYVDFSGRPRSLKNMTAKQLMNALREECLRLFVLERAPGWDATPHHYQNWQRTVRFSMGVLAAELCTREPPCNNADGPPNRTRPGSVADLLEQGAPGTAILDAMVMEYVIRESLQFRLRAPDSRLLPERDRAGLLRRQELSDEMFTNLASALAVTAPQHKTEEHGP